MKENATISFAIVPETDPRYTASATMEDLSATLILVRTPDEEKRKICEK